MRKVIVSEFVSLDGVVEDPKWTFQFGSDEQEEFKLDELAAADALLLGRVTYEGFAAAWPSATDEEGYADRMNGYPKHVVSTTLEDWKSRWSGTTRPSSRATSPRKCQASSSGPARTSWSSAAQTSSTR
jgi:dihydrofolate reductase